jgi:fumarate reductase subunit C
MNVYDRESSFSKWWKSRTFIQKRLFRFGVSTLVMAVCLPLYYLGFFGTVEGPLNPGRIGDFLAGLGVTKTHSLVFFLSLLVMSIAWNWVYNLVSYLGGARVTCNKVDEGGKPCGARAERRKVVQKKSGERVNQYVCTEGHKRPEAHFHPVQKGPVSHAMWVMALAFCVIVLFLS